MLTVSSTGTPLLLEVPGRSSGERINLVFEADLWRLPLFVEPKRTAIRSNLLTAKTAACSPNPYALLASKDDGEETESDSEDNGAYLEEGAQREEGSQRKQQSQRNKGAQQLKTDAPVGDDVDPTLYAEWLDVHARWAHPRDGH
mmetsp:Transcript_70818/g.147575  ORF Transcript_70818/g.147575 Transcript_70818/m.147575 type:complete len:144 (+) Transcript_70818:306-737(+)